MPVGRVGLYVPGGLAVYPSSVVMNVVPAQVAGVASIAVASPPQREHGGWPHPTILAACALLGVDEVYAAGGAQAVAMLAYGAGPCAPVDLVTGPGNVYVAAAKRLLRGRVGIDAEAGPDRDRRPRRRHRRPGARGRRPGQPGRARRRSPPRSWSPTSAELADAVEAELPVQVAATKHVERITAALAGEQSGVVLVDDVDAALRVVDAYAAEHLEVHTRDAAAVAARVRNAGAIFVGTWAPVSLGDYAPGPTTSCRPVGAPATAVGCRCRRSCAASTSSTTPPRRCATSPTPS